MLVYVLSYEHGSYSDTTSCVCGAYSSQEKAEYARDVYMREVLEKNRDHWDRSFAQCYDDGKKGWPASHHPIRERWLDEQAREFFWGIRAIEVDELAKGRDDVG